MSAGYSADPTLAPNNGRPQIPPRPHQPVMARNGSRRLVSHQTDRESDAMRPEDVIADRRRPYTGAEYIQSLRDGRAVYIDGERVRDVTTHPAFHNSIRPLARLYAALPEPKRRDPLTCPTDTGSGGYTHRFFRVQRSREELIGAQGAIAEWSRMTYGWMGRTPDYKAAFTNTLGANAAYYGPYADNARAWYR